jgi:hypothetical protein
MGIFSGLIKGATKLFSGGVLGKAKNLIGKGIKLFDKAKSGYGAIKNTISSLPVVGGIAEGLVKQGETKLVNMIKEKTGVEAQSIEKGVDMARKFVAPTPM